MVSRAENPWIANGQPMVIGHRGHPVGTPEQTLASFRHAARAGAEMVEADVRRTRDGQLVLMHDATLERTTDGRGLVREHTYAELRERDAGGWFGPQFAGERIPTLAELFELADEYGIALCLEAKGETPEEAALVCLAVAGEIAARGRLARDVLASFDHAALHDAARAVPGLAIAPDRLPERGPSSAAAIVEQAHRVGAPVIQHHHADLTADVVAGAHAAGLAIWAWPTTTAAEIDRALALGVDGLMGDDVDAIVAAVRAARPLSLPRQGATSTAQPLSAER